MKIASVNLLEISQLPHDFRVYNLKTIALSKQKPKKFAANKLPLKKKQAHKRTKKVLPKEENVSKRN